MSSFPKNHDTIYFDVLRRTQKLETVLSLIMATYKAHRNNAENLKECIAELLKPTYQLYLKDSGNYNGSIGAFDSQYTIGHEACIWNNTNNNFELTPYAKKVAEQKLSMREYFDLFFLNYIQPINNIIVHPLFEVLSKMNSHNIKILSKNELVELFSSFSKEGVETKTENVNSLVQFLICTNYFDFENNELKYISKIDIKELISLCNKKYINQDYEIVKAKLNTEVKYIDYVFTNYENSDESNSKYIYLPISFNFEGSKDELEQKLAKILAQDKNIRGSYAIHYFGLRYADFISKNNLNVSRIIELSNIGDNYKIELNKGIGIFKLIQEDGFIKSKNINSEKFTEKSSQSSPSFTPSQIIYYGVPGTGKSYKIDNEKTIGFSDEQKMRVVFHPEYSNADFVGQILPTLKDDKVDYRFKPGPFTEILRRAYLNPSTPYALIIEEINRGNAAAILGDIFQLLDRIKKDDKTVIESENTYTEGWSSYSINNEFINWYFREGFFHEGYERETNPNVQIENEELKSIKINNGIKISANTGIRLPPNLSIYATMNTSDQNVFTLDNAFQRRWDMELVKNEFGDLDETKNQREAIIENLEISWEQFQNNINSIIAEKSSELGLSSMEDKRLGCWFVKAEQKEGEYKITKEVFAQKVLKYLYDDAFKFSRSEVFSDKFNTFEQLSNAFINPKNTSGFDIFTTDVKSRLNEMLKQAQSKVEQQIPDQVGNDNNISENE